ncbi:MAG: hypothetical protein IT372_24870 [Polyangiaceae bacterium]|nr:hypothetical protein [Polyangiaceae bacterium]
MTPLIERALERGVRRVPGGEAAAKLLLVRLETLRAVLGKGLDQGNAPVPDAIVPEQIPSVAELGLADRVLAEIDQDGFAFAAHPADVPFFNRRAERFPRLRYELHVVLHRGRVCVRKRFTGQPRDAPLGAKVWHGLGLFFYTEAAVLLRLRDAPIAPRLRGVELTSRTLYMDYIRGRTLQHEIAARGRKILDIDLAPLGQLFDPDRDRREIEALAGEGGDRYKAPLLDLVRAMNARGVAPLDVKLGNVLIGEKTGALYWLDYERAALSGVPGYAAHLAEHHRLVDAWFGLSTAHGGRG